MKKLIALFLVSVFALTGCATNRGYLGIQVPTNSITNPNGEQVYIRSITDNRQFQEKPRNPSTPSLGFGGLAAADQEMKSRAIARKRNGYGKALGDILLEEGQTVQSVIYEATRNSLYSLGYDVVNNPEEAKSDAIVVDISIDKFWAWFMPGVWTLSLKSEITTVNTITAPRSHSPITITASSRNYCQMANTANWRKTLKLVVDDFIKKAELELRNLETAPNN